MKLFSYLLFSTLLTSLLAPNLVANPLVFEGTEGVGKGKHIVFIANDHEYRSEETCPALAKILAKHHGFKCTVLFGLDEEGHIKAGDVPIPGIEVLGEADLLFFFTRFMNLPSDQVEHIVNYFERGGPTVGVRTTTHCFNKQGGDWGKLNFNYAGEDYRGGLGEQVYGNTWHRDRGQSHYGSNHAMGGTISGVASAKEHPILIGVEPMHTYSGAYKSQPPADATPLLEVQVLNTFGPSKDINKEKEIVNAGWARDSYVAPSGAKKEGRVVYTSFGASEDLLDENARRFLVNSCLWAIGMEDKIQADLAVDLVGGFSPSAYSGTSLYRTKVKPADLAGWESSVMPADAGFAGFGEGSKPNPRFARVLQNRPELLKKIQEVHPDFDPATLKAAPKKKKNKAVK